MIDNDKLYEELSLVIYLGVVHRRYNLWDPRKQEYVLKNKSAEEINQYIDKLYRLKSFI